VKVIKIVKNHRKTSEANSSIGQDLPAQRPNWKRLLPIAALIMGFLAFLFFGASEYLSLSVLDEKAAELRKFVEINFGLAVAIYFVSYVLSTAFFLPVGTILTLSGGLFFGTLHGGMLAVFGATIGSSILFIAARYAFSEFFNSRLGRHAPTFRQKLNQNAFFYLLALRLVPIFPFVVVNVVPALVGIPIRTYVISTFIGIIPGTFIYAGIGAGLGSIFSADGKPNLNVLVQWEFLLPLILLACLSLVPTLWRPSRQED